MPHLHQIGVSVALAHAEPVRVQAPLERPHVVTVDQTWVHGRSLENREKYMMLTQWPGPVVREVDL